MKRSRDSKDGTVVTSRGLALSTFINGASDEATFFVSIVLTLSRG